MLLREQNTDVLLGECVLFNFEQFSAEPVLMCQYMWYFLTMFVYLK